MRYGRLRVCHPPGEIRRTSEAEPRLHGRPLGVAQVMRTRHLDRDEQVARPGVPLPLLTTYAQRGRSAQRESPEE